jgi:hypothetical protein
VPEGTTEVECQLMTVQAMADGNWRMGFVAPFRAGEDVAACNKLYGWRLRMVLELHPSSWD